MIFFLILGCILVFLVSRLLYSAYIMVVSETKRSTFLDSINNGNTLRSLSDFPELEESFEVLKKGQSSFLVKNLKTEKLSQILFDDIHLYKLDK